MKPRTLSLALAASVLAGPAPADMPYAGQQARAIKALSDDDIAALRKGEGMGVAKAAELNGYPGPAHVLVLAADLPFLGAELVHRLWTSVPGHDGAVLIDREGKDQWLAACYRREALTAAIDRLRAQHGGTAGLSLKRLLAGFDLARVPDPDGQSFDCDTWEDVGHVRRLVDGGVADHRPPGTEPER